MTYGSNQQGEAYFNLTPQEHEKFKQGLPVNHVVGSASGYARITIIQVPIPDPFADNNRTNSEN
jgi:hypothetical protein